MPFKINAEDDGMPDFEELQRIGDDVSRKEDEENSPKQPQSDDKDNKRSINYLFMPTWLWKWLIEVSNAEGMKLERFIVMLLKEANRNWKEPLDSDDAETYVAWARQKSDANVAAYDDAYAIAVNYKSYPTEDNMRLLIKSCERLGTDPEELIKKASTDAYAELIVQYRSDPDSKMSRCIKWVIDFCRDKNEIPSRVFNETGERAGFTRQMLHSARRKCGIKSILRGGEYYLVMSKSARVLSGTSLE